MFCVSWLRFKNQFTSTDSRYGTRNKLMLLNSKALSPNVLDVYIEKKFSTFSLERDSNRVPTALQSQTLKKVPRPFLGGNAGEKAVPPFKFKFSGPHEI